MTLKDSIAEKHKIAEQMLFNQRMFRGELDPYEYGMYLYQLLQIFRQMERFGLLNKNLCRVDAIKQDIAELELTNQLYAIDSTRDYIVYLATSTYEQTLPHIYLHYLALMYGGQMMKSKVPGNGHIFDFEDITGCIQSIRELQDDSWATEANKGLDYFIDILDELQHLSRFSR